MVRPILVVLAAAALALPSAAGAQERPAETGERHAEARDPAPDAPAHLGLEEAVNRATSVNEDVLIARAERARAAGIVKEVRSDALPRISANFGYTRNIQTPVLFLDTEEGVQQVSIGNDNDYTFGLTLSQTLFDFSLGPARTAARLSRRASAELVESARDRVALRTRESYYGVLLARELVRVQEQALEQAEARLEQVRQFHRAGTAAEFDLLTARVEVDNVRPDVIDARNQLELTRNQLKRTVGLSLERELVLTDGFPTAADSLPAEAAYVQEALRNRSDLRGQEIRVDLQQENLTARERSALPALELTAGLSRRASSGDLVPPEEDFSQTVTAGLAFSVPLFDGRERAGQVQQASAELNREEYRLRQLRENVRLEVQQSYQALQAARERIEATSATVDRAERALEIAQTRFENGLSTQVELNDAELAVTRARTNQARARHDYAVALARLLAATGER